MATRRRQDDQLVPARAADSLLRAQDAFDWREFIGTLRGLISRLPAEPQVVQRGARQIRVEIDEAVRRLRAFSDAVDPVRQPSHVFDPSDPRQMGQLIAQTLLVQRRESFPDLTKNKFYGSGVYAIYYEGAFPAYTPIANTETPIYIGKVDPAVPNAATPYEQESRLWGRLVGDHARNIGFAENLESSDFRCRYLVVRSAWQNTAEEYLIDRFKPIWNNEVNICYGFGKHGDSASKRSNTRSPWDTLHPGRPWAWAEGNEPNPKSVADIVAEIGKHFRAHPAERDIPITIDDR